MEAKQVTIAIGGVTVVTASVAAALLAPCGPLGDDTTTPDDPAPKLDVGGIEEPEPEPTGPKAFGINLDYWQSFYSVSTLATDARLLAQIYAPGVEVDEHGYPAQETHGQFRLILFNAPYQAHVADYRVTWEGSGRVVPGRSCSSTGTIDGGFLLHVSGGECHLDIVGRISDLKVVRTGVRVCPNDPFSEYIDPGTCEDGTSRIDIAEAYARAPHRWRWMPAMHRDLARYGGMRTMMATRTNECPVADVTRYTTPSSLSYSATGAAYRHLFDLATTVGLEYVWVTTPWCAEDLAAWAQHIAQAAKDAGYPGLVPIELANEWWNSIFRSAQNVVALLAARYPDQVPEGSNAGAIQLDAAAKFVPRETVKLCEAFDAALGEQARCVLAGHSGGLDPSGIDPYSGRPYDLTTHSFSSGTYNRRLLDLALEVDVDDRIDYFAVAPYWTGSTFRDTPSANAYREHMTSRAPTGIWRATAAANGIRAENVRRGELGRPPLGLAFYELGGHAEAQGSMQQEILMLMRAIEQGDDAIAQALHEAYLLHLTAVRADLPWAPAAAFAQTMTTSAPWGYWDPHRPCREHAKCRAMDTALGRIEESPVSADAATQAAVAVP